MADASAYAKGVMGEIAACGYLEERGLLPIARRYRSPYGEADLVLLDGEVLVFAEVKARERGTSASACFSVTPAKQRRLVLTARCFLAEYPQHACRIVRFDVITVTHEGVRHIPNAFEGMEW